MANYIANNGSGGEYRTGGAGGAAFYVVQNPPSADGQTVSHAYDRYSHCIWVLYEVARNVWLTRWELNGSGVFVEPAAPVSIGAGRGASILVLPGGKLSILYTLTTGEVRHIVRNGLSGANEASETVCTATGPAWHVLDRMGRMLVVATNWPDTELNGQLLIRLGALNSDGLTHTWATLDPVAAGDRVTGGLVALPDGTVLLHSPTAGLRQARSIQPGAAISWKTIATIPNANTATMTLDRRGRLVAAVYVSGTGWGFNVGQVYLDSAGTDKINWTFEPSSGSTAMSGVPADAASAGASLRALPDNSLSFVYLNPSGIPQHRVCRNLPSGSWS